MALDPVKDENVETVVPPQSAPDVPSETSAEPVRVEIRKPAEQDVRNVLTVAEDFRLGQKTGVFVYPENRARFEAQEKYIPNPRIIGEGLGESGLLDKEDATKTEKAVTVEAQAAEQQFEQPITPDSFRQRIETGQVEEVHKADLERLLQVIDNPDNYPAEGVENAKIALDRFQRYYERERTKTVDDPRAQFEGPMGGFVPTPEMQANPKLLSEGAKRFTNDLILLNSTEGMFEKKGYSSDDSDALQKLVLENVSSGEFWDMFVERANEGIVRGAAIYTPELALNGINAVGTATAWAGINLTAAVTPFLEGTGVEDGASFGFLWEQTAPERQAFREGWQNLLNDSLGLKTASRAWNDYLYEKLREKVDSGEMSQEQFNRLTTVPDPENPEAPPIQRDFLSEDDVFKIIADATETLTEKQQWFLSYLEAGVFVAGGVASKHRKAVQSWEELKTDIAAVRAGERGAEAQKLIEGLDDFAAYWKLRGTKETIKLVKKYNEKDLVIGRRNEISSEGVSRLADRIDELDSEIIRISSINNADPRLIGLRRERQSLNLQKTRAKYFDNLPVSIIKETQKSVIPLSFVQYKAGEFLTPLFEDRLAAEAMGSVGYLTVGKGAVALARWGAGKANLATGDAINRMYVGIEHMVDYVAFSRAQRKAGKTTQGILSDSDITAYAAALRAKGVRVTGREIATFNWIRNLASAMDDKGREVVADYMEEQYDLIQDILGSYEGDPVAQEEVAALLSESLATASGLSWMDAAAKIATGEVRMGKIASFEAINAAQGLQEMHEMSIQRASRLIKDLRKRLENDEILSPKSRERLERYIMSLEQGVRQSTASLGDSQADLNREVKNLKAILLGDTFGIIPLDDHQLRILNEVELRTSLSLNPDLDEVSEANRIHKETLEMITERANRLKELHGDADNTLKVVSTFETLVNEVWRNIKFNARRGYIELDKIALRDGTRVNVAPLMREMMNLAKNPNRPETTSLSKFFGRESKFWAGSLGRNARKAFNDMAFRALGDLKPETYQKLVALHSNAKRADGTPNPYYIDVDGAELQPLDIALWYAENKPDTFKGFDALPGEVMDMYSAFREYGYRTKDAGLAAVYKEYLDVIKKAVRDSAGDDFADRWDKAAQTMKVEWFDRLRIDGPVGKMQAAQTGAKSNAALAEDSGVNWVDLKDAETGDFLVVSPEDMAQRARTALTKPVTAPQLFTEILSYTYKGNKTPDKILAELAELIEGAFTGNLRDQTDLQVAMNDFFSEISGRSTTTGMPVFDASDEKQMALVAAASAVIEAYLYDNWARQAQETLKKVDAAQIGPKQAADMINLDQVDAVRRALKFAIEYPNGTQQPFSPINIDRLLLQNNSILHELGRSEEAAASLAKSRDLLNNRIDAIQEATKGHQAIRDAGMEAVYAALKIKRDGLKFIEEVVNTGSTVRLQALQEQAVKNLVGKKKYDEGDFEYVIELTGETVDARDVVADGIAHLAMEGLMELGGFTVGGGKPLLNVTGDDTLKLATSPETLVALFEGENGDAVREVLTNIFQKRILYGESVLEPGSNLARFEVTTVSKAEAEAHVESLVKIFKFLNISQKSDISGYAPKLTGMFRSPGANWFLSRGFNLRRGQVSAPYVMGELAVSIATAAGVDMLKMAASSRETADYMLRMMKYPKSMTSKEIDLFAISVVDFVQSEMGRMGLEFIDYIPEGTPQDIQNVYTQYVTEGQVSEQTFIKKDEKE